MTFVEQQKLMDRVATLETLVNTLRDEVDELEDRKWTDQGLDLNDLAQCINALEREVSLHTRFDCDIMIWILGENSIELDVNDLNELSAIFTRLLEFKRK